MRQDEDGYFFVVDRLKDMIISGGENIYCAEVEDVLAAHPKVGEVALIGVPDTKYGEAPLAVVAPRDPADPPTAEELAAWCREKLARYKNPREYSIVGALPRNPSGKVLKTSLRQEHSVPAIMDRGRRRPGCVSELHDRFKSGQLSEGRASTRSSRAERSRH